MHPSGDRVTAMRFSSPAVEDLDLAVEVRRPDLTLVARTTLSQVVDVAPGRYQVSGRLPSGTELFGAVNVADASAHVVLEPALETDLEPDLDEARIFVESITDDSLIGSPGAADEQTGEEVTLRRLAGNPLRGAIWVQSSRPEWVVEGRSLLIEGQDRATLLQLVQPETQAINVAVPLGAGQTGKLRLAPAPDGMWAVEIHLAHTQADLLCRYRDRGWTQEAAAVASSPELDAEQLLKEKQQDPIGAAVGGYALLRFSALDRLHDWTANLHSRFAWLPDGAVIRGEHLARLGQHADALDAFLTLPDRGLPLFSDGLAYAVNRLRLYVDAGGDTVVGGHLDAAQATLARLEPFASAVDFGQPILTFAGDPFALAGQTG